MRATVLPLKPLVRVKKTDKGSKTRTTKRFDWITNSDMEDINEVDTRGRGFDYSASRKEE
jgi:hypothetical protein